MPSPLIRAHRPQNRDWQTVDAAIAAYRADRGGLYATLMAGALMWLAALIGSLI